MDKFAGVGMVNLLLIWIMCIMFTLVAKVVLVKYPVKGLTEIITA